MNNRYICKGKRKDNGEWIYGDLIIDQYGKYYIHPNANAFSVNEYNLAKCIQMIEVIPETVGQCTGLEDKNGKLIFEGDIVHFKTPAYHYKNCRIKYQSFYARYCAIDNKGYEYPMDKAFEYEIIGNIRDNPDLLKVKR